MSVPGTGREARNPASPSCHGGSRTASAPRSVAEHAEGGPRSGAREGVGGGRLDAAGRSRSRPKRLAARSNHVQRPPPAAWKIPVASRSASVDQRRGEMAGPGRAALLVGDDLDRVALGGEPQDRVDEVLAVGAEQPRGARDRVVRVRRGDLALAGELRAAVGRARAGRRWTPRTARSRRRGRRSRWRGGRCARPRRRRRARGCRRPCRSRRARRPPGPRRRRRRCRPRS